MEYSQAIAYIESLSRVYFKPEMKGEKSAALSESAFSTPSLERFQLFLQEQDNPQDKYPVIHIGGTNGKGSVTALVDSVLTAAGLNSARYIGPHLLRWNERYHVGGKPVSDETLGELTARLKGQADVFAKRHLEQGPLTWFEFITAMDFYHIAACNVEATEVEVGLGGRWDATTAVTSPLVTCIVTVGMDHMHILGETIEKIAAEKAGIIKRGIPIITAAQGAALAVIRRRAHELEAPLIVCAFPADSEFALEVTGDTGALDALPQLAQQHITPALLSFKGGRFQKQNAVVASVVLAVAQLRGAFRVTPLDYLSVGLSHFFWPGRFQYLQKKHVLLDGAHHAPAAPALRIALDESFPGQRAFVLGAYQNKDVPEMLQHLLRSGDRVFASEPGGARAAFPVGELLSAAQQAGCSARAFSNLAEAFKAALAERRADETVVCTGSFVAVKEAMLALGCRTVEETLPLTARKG